VCQSVDEAQRMQRALEDPMVRAFVSIVGAMLPLSDRARTRVLTFMNDKLDEEAGAITIESHARGGHDVTVTGTVRNAVERGV
jgi:hypothetical protein